MMRTLVFGAAFCAVLALAGCNYQSTVHEGLGDSMTYMNVRVTLIPRTDGFPKFQEHPVFLLTITQGFVKLQEHGESPEDNGPYTLVPMELIRELTFRADPDKPW